MANKNQKTVVRESAGTTPFALVVTGIVCLLAGLGLGYYFGQQSPAGSAATVPMAPVPMPQGQVIDPNTFLQNETVLKSALSSNPRDLNSLIRLGNLYYDSSRWNEAVDYYGRALEIDPKNVNVRTDRGTAYWNMSQPDPAIAEFRKSLEVDPGHAQTLYNMGVVYLHGKGDLNEARGAWQKLLATNPNYPDRAKVEQQLAELSGSVPGGPAAAPAQGAEDLLEKLKSHK